jgi:gas vesicle protein GvpA/GvpJ/GvpM family
MGSEPRVDDTEQLVLSDLLNRVLDRGVVISGTVTISVADVDLLRVGLNVFIAAIEAELQRSADRERNRGPLLNANVPLLHPPGGG